MIRRLLIAAAVALLTTLVFAGGWRWLPGEYSAASPAGVPWGVPGRAVKIASFNTLSNERGEGRVLAELRAMDADYLLLQEVQEKDVAGMAEALGMKFQYVAATFPPDPNVKAGSKSRGSAISTNFPSATTTG